MRGNKLSGSLNTLLALLLLLVLQPVCSFALDEGTPFFTGNNGAPNVMIIFDNSDSMKYSPYKTAAGIEYEPNTEWRKGVKIVEDCGDGVPCIETNASGSIQYESNKYRILDDEPLVLPSQAVPNLPGLFTFESTVSTVRDTDNDCPDELECDDRIYDSNLTWSEPTMDAARMASDYKYAKIEIIHEDGSVQYRNLSDYHAPDGDEHGYWEVFGDDIQYDNTLNVHGEYKYTYRIIDPEPGEVTTDSTINSRRVTYASSNAVLIYDKNFDWSAMTTYNYQSFYEGRKVEITEGVHSGIDQPEGLVLEPLDTDPDGDYTLEKMKRDGFWKVSTEFVDGDGNPLACDYSSSYRIIGNYNEDRKAKGGNHPDSKMYKAKLALGMFLNSESISTCGEYDEDDSCIWKRYLMNFGFATYMQARIPRTYARYYRKVAATDPDTDSARYRAYYRRNRSTSSTVTIDNGCVNRVKPDTFDFSYDGKDYTDAQIGDVADRRWNNGKACFDQRIRYRVNSTWCETKDGPHYNLKISLTSYTHYSNGDEAGSGGVDDLTGAELAGEIPYTGGADQWGLHDAPYYYWDTTDETNNCAAHDGIPAHVFPATKDGHTLITGTGDACADTYPCRYYPEDEIDETIAYYTKKWKEVTGDFRISDPSKAGYINRNPLASSSYIVTPYAGKCDGGWDDCESPDPEAGEWTLITEVMTGKVDDTSGSTSTFYPAIYDTSYYAYPGRNETDRPHGWSYKRTATAAGESWTMDDGSSLADHRIGVLSDSWTGHNTIWSDTVQPETFFPSQSGGGMSNYLGDDQLVFIDLPTPGDDSTDPGDDIKGVNRKKIQSYINLARFRKQNDSNWHHTMAPHNPNSLAVNSHKAVAGAETPLAATLTDAKKYFESYIAQDQLSQDGCRENYIILITDGEETCATTTDDDGNTIIDHSKPVASAAALQTIIGDDGSKIPVKVYVVGFGLDNSSKIKLNAIAQAGGTNNSNDEDNEAFFANDVEELVEILAKDIASEITGGSFGRGNAVITRSSKVESEGLNLYFGYFDYPVWRGHLEAYAIDEDTGLISDWVSGWDKVCVDAGGLPTAVSDAGCIMATTVADRTILTNIINGAAWETIGFSTAERDDLKLLLFPDGDDADALADVLDIDGDSDKDDDDVDAVIGFVRHPAEAAGKYEGSRDKTWPLADLYNSGPVLVPAPLNGGCVDIGDGNGLQWAGMNGYCAHTTTNASRETMIYVGANGGMVEAFSAATGVEKWGYIPSFALSRLQEIRFGHRWSMDLNIAVAEADVSSNVHNAPADWKTILIAGQREGGSSYIALDITDPTIAVDPDVPSTITAAPSTLWEFTLDGDSATPGFSGDSGVGETWSQPSFGRVSVNGVGTSVVFLGGGYSGEVNSGNYIYIVKASDGTLLKKLDLGANGATANNSVPGGMRTVRYGLSKVGEVVDYRTGTTDDSDGNPVAQNLKYFIEVVYFGDTDGNLWRISGLNRDANWADNVTLTKMYVPPAGEAQPIFYKPAIYDSRKGICNKRAILFGTGNDATNITRRALTQNYFYNIEDTGLNGANSATLKWRLSLGKQLPQDQYGFLLDENGAYVVNTDADKILSSNTFILDHDVYLEDPDYEDAAWSVNGDGQLVTPDGVIVELVLVDAEDEADKVVERIPYLIRDEITANLYKSPAKSTLIAASGTYVVEEISEWSEDAAGCLVRNPDVGETCLMTSSDYRTPTGDGMLANAAGDPIEVTDLTGDKYYVPIVTAQGEKVLSTPTVFAGNVYFTSYSPLGGCSMGTSFLYGISASNCRDDGGDGVLGHDSSGEKITAGPRRKLGLGRGITPGPVVSSPRLYLPSFKGKGNKPEILSYEIEPDTMKLRYWKQN